MTLPSVSGVSTGKSKPRKPRTTYAPRTLGDTVMVDGKSVVLTTPAMLRAYRSLYVRG